MQHTLFHTSAAQGVRVLSQACDILFLCLVGHVVQGGKEASPIYQSGSRHGKSRRRVWSFRRRTVCQHWCLSKTLLVATSYCLLAAILRHSSHKSASPCCVCYVCCVFYVSVLCVCVFECFVVCVCCVLCVFLVCCVFRGEVW